MLEPELHADYSQPLEQNDLFSADWWARQKGVSSFEFYERQSFLHSRISPGPVGSSRRIFVEPSLLAAVQAIGLDAGQTARVYLKNEPFNLLQAPDATIIRVENGVELYKGGPNRVARWLKGPDTWMEIESPKAKQSILSTAAQAAGLDVGQATRFYLENERLNPFQAPDAIMVRVENGVELYKGGPNRVARWLKGPDAWMEIESPKLEQPWNPSA